MLPNEPVYVEFDIGVLKKALELDNMQTEGDRRYNDVNERQFEKA